MTAPLLTKHDTDTRRFVIAHPEGYAELTYKLESSVMLITHTFVPTSLRGQGVAEALTRTALAWASQTDLRVIPQCSYVARFIERHPEFQPLLIPSR